MVVLLCEYASKVFDAKFKNVLITIFRRLFVRGVLQSKKEIENPQELYSVYNNEIQTLIGECYLLIPNVFFQALSVLWYTVILFYLNSRVAVFVLLANLITMWIPYAFEKNLQYLKDQNTLGLRKLNLMFHDIVEGLKTIHDYMVHKRIFQKVEESSSNEKRRRS